MDGITESGRISDKCKIGDGSSGVIVSITGRNLFVQGSNTAMKMNGAIAVDSATGPKKFTTR